MRHENNNNLPAPPGTTPQWIAESIQDISRRLRQAKAMDELPHDIHTILLHIRATMVALDQGGVSICTQIVENQDKRYVTTLFTNQEGIEDVFSEPDDFLADLE